MSVESAGRFFARGGRLIRPAQNCAERYGGALALCEVLELTPSTYRECVIDNIGPGWLAGNAGFHTLSFSPRLEVIDGRMSRTRRDGAA